MAVLDPFSALDGWRKGGVALSGFRAEVPFVINCLYPLHAPRPALLTEFLPVLHGVVRRAEREIEKACSGVADRLDDQ